MAEPVTSEHVAPVYVQLPHLQHQSRPALQAGTVWISMRFGMSLAVRVTAMRSREILIFK